MRLEGPELSKMVLQAEVLATIGLVGMDAPCPFGEGTMSSTTSRSLRQPAIPAWLVEHGAKQRARGRG